MIRLRHKLLIHGLRLFDQLSLAVALFVSVALAKGVSSLVEIEIVFHRTYALRDIVGLVLVLAAWSLIYHHFVAYNVNRFSRFSTQILELLQASAVTAFTLLAIAVLFDFETLSPGFILVFWCLAFGLGVAGRALLRWLLVAMRRSGYTERHLLIVGNNPQARELARRLDDHPELGYRIVGFIDETLEEGAAPEKAAPPEGQPPVLGGMDRLVEILEDEAIDEIMLSLPFEKRFAEVSRALRLGQEIGVVVRLIPDDEAARILQRLQIESFEGDTVVTFFRENLLLQLLAKRLIDFFGAAALVALLSPLLLAAAAAVKLTSPGPVFFAQERVGMNKRRFKLLKFRSMVADAERRRKEIEHLNEVDGPVFKIKDDPRITKVGRLIRKTSIDELPQLFNVLAGHMSLVGPRPPLPSEVDQYEWLYRRRLSIKPGITCLWQVSGRNQLSFDQWMELDKQYIDNWSLWLDIKILLKTVPVVLTGHGAS